jgi:hypothetical protein
MLVTVPSFTKITLLHSGCEYPRKTDVTQLLSQTYMMQSKEHWVQMKSNIIMFLHCIERRCHLYNPQDGGRKTQKIQMQESWCTWQWKNATGFSGKKFSELDYFWHFNLRLFTTENQVCSNLTLWFHWKPHAWRAVIRIPKFPSFQYCIESVLAAICISVFSHYKWHSYLSTFTYNLQPKT